MVSFDILVFLYSSGSKIHKTDQILYIIFWYSQCPNQDKVPSIIVIIFPPLSVIVVSRIPDVSTL